MKVKSLTHVQLFVTPWTVAYQPSPSMGFSRQECWSGLPFPSPRDLPNPGIEPVSPALQVDALPSETPGKQPILSAPALTLPNLSCSFVLFTTERHKIALRVLGQNQGPSFTPVAYLSKQLDTTIQRWPACLRALAAAALLIQESEKLIFGAPTVICSPHDFKNLLSHKSMTLPISFTHPTNSCNPSRISPVLL